MSRFEIQITRRDGARRRVVLGRFASVIATIVVTLLAIAALIVGLAFGYLVIGIVLAVLLAGVVVAIVRGAWTSVWRNRGGR